MEHTIIFGPEWVEVRTSGKAELQGFRAFGEAVAADPRWKPGLNLLIDHSQLDLSEFKAQEMVELGRGMNRNHPLKDCRRCAFYTPNPLQFGFGRMWQQHSMEPTQRSTRVFDSREQAEAWLRSEADHDSEGMT